MERWAALAQIESGNNDHALGAAGEISRYQIKPRVWHRYAPLSANWHSAEQSLPIAKAAMRERCANFEHTFGRPPTDFEFYVLWNAPAQIRKPSSAVSKRAQRFCNLVQANTDVAAAPAEPVVAAPGLESSPQGPVNSSSSPALKFTQK
jgi:hypothetical protein